MGATAICGTAMPGCCITTPVTGICCCITTPWTGICCCITTWPWMGWDCAITTWPWMGCISIVPFRELSARAQLAALKPGAQGLDTLHNIIIGYSRNSYCTVLQYCSRNSCPLGPQSLGAMGRAARRGYLLQSYCIVPVLATSPPSLPGNTELEIIHDPGRGT